MIVSIYYKTFNSQALLGNKTTYDRHKEYIDTVVTDLNNRYILRI